MVGQSGTGSVRHLCIHGHFYQPPRENPWLEMVEVQDSAAPYHDWNERIAAECYEPNGAARILDGEQMVVGLLNNYAQMSFNVGPTLLAWLQRHAPEVVEAIREGERMSRERHGGHGNALAQPYNHSILPLDGKRDRATQVRWGIHAFRAFYGRDPEGMWLPETAVDTLTLEALAREGIRFTVLAPHQAHRVRSPGSTTWVEVRGNVDTTRPYRCRLPSGREIAVFFYNGALSRAVAFEGLLKDGETFYQSLLSSFRPDSSEPQLVHIATDGESYGHHHRFGEMALAYVLDRAMRDPSVRLTNYGEFLTLHPPQWEAEIRERTSWSCAHGVERWRANCGCHSGGNPAWHQRWRGPLREALMGLKDRLDRIFERESQRLLRDPWAARDDYIRVVLERAPAILDPFWEAHRGPAASTADLPKTVRLLEMQRHGLLMFTSCGWFFDEISGLEATQILRYAARAMQLAESLGTRLEEDFVRVLEAAESNRPEFVNGRGVWEKAVRPAAADLRRVVSHYAIRSLFREWRNVEDLYGFHIHNLHEHVESLGTTQVALGRVHVSSTVTLEEVDALFAVIHFGGLDFSSFQRPSTSHEELRALQTKILETYRSLSVGDVYALMREQFPPPVHRLNDLFLDEQRHIVQTLLNERFQDYLHTMEVLAEQDLGILTHLASLGFPIPTPLVTASTVHVNRRVDQILEDLPEDGNGLDEADDLLRRSLPWGYCPDRENWGRSLLRRMEEALEGLASGSRSPAETFSLCQKILEASERLEISMNLWRAQNLLIRACQQGPWDRWGDLLKDAEALARRLRLREILLPWNQIGGRASTEGNVLP